MRQALLSGDASDEDDGGAVGVDAQALEGGGGHGVGLLALRVLPGLEVDAVVDDLDALRVDGGVAAQDVFAHAVGDRDDPGGGLVGGLLRPGGQGVAAAELLGLPGAQGLQGVGADDVGDAVEETGQVPGEVGVPGVGVDEVGSLGALGHLQVDSEGAQGGVGAVELGDLGVAGDAVVGALGTGLAGAAEGVDADVGQGAQDLGELVDVDPGAAVDEGWVLLGQQVDPHGCASPLSDGWTDRAFLGAGRAPAVGRAPHLTLYAHGARWDRSAPVVSTDSPARGRRHPLRSGGGDTRA